MSIFSGIAGTGGQILMGLRINIGTSGGNRLVALGKKVFGLRKSFISMGITTIFLDRLVQSLTRAWRGLNEVFGVMRVAKTSEDILKLSKFSGVATGQLQAFAGAASVVGAELNDVSDLFQTLTERIDDVRSGEKGIAEDFARFGLTASTFQNANGGLEKFLAMMKQLDTLAPDRRMAALEKILGGGLAQKFGQMGNVQEIAAAMQEAIDTGLVLSKQRLKEGQRFARAQRRIGRLMKALSNTVGSALLPVLTRAADVLGNTIKPLLVFLNNNAVKFGTHIDKSFKPLLDGLDRLRGFFDKFIKDDGETMARLLHGMLVAVMLIGGVVFGPFIGKAAVLGAAVLAIAIAVDDIMTSLRGGDGRLLPYLKALGQWLRGMPLIDLMMRSIFLFALQLRDTIQQVVSGVIAFARGPVFPLLLVMAAGVLQTFGLVLQFMGHLFHTVVRIVNVVVEAVSLLVQLLTGGLIGLFGNSGPLDAFTRRLGRSGGFSGAISNAFTGAGPTTTNQLFYGAGMAAAPAPPIQITQNNNVNAVTSDPDSFINMFMMGQGRGIANVA